MSERRAKAPISAIHFVAGNPAGLPHALRRTRMNSRCACSLHRPGHNRSQAHGFL